MSHYREATIERMSELAKAIANTGMSIDDINRSIGSLRASLKDTSAFHLSANDAITPRTAYFPKENKTNCINCAGNQIINGKCQHCGTKY